MQDKIKELDKRIKFAEKNNEKNQDTYKKTMKGCNNEK